MFEADTIEELEQEIHRLKAELESEKQRHEMHSNLNGTLSAQIDKLKPVVNAAVEYIRAEDEVWNITLFSTAGIELLRTVEEYNHDQSRT
jgi:hypothetical protein